MCGGQHKAYAAARKIIDHTPYARPNVQTDVRSVERDRRLSYAIVKVNHKTARKRQEKLM